MKHFTRKQLRKAFNRLSAKEPISKSSLLTAAAYYDAMLDRSESPSMEESIQKFNEVLNLEGKPEISKERLAAEFAKVHLLTKADGSDFTPVDVACIVGARVLYGKQDYGKCLTNIEARAIRVIDCLYDVKMQAPKPL